MCKTEIPCPCSISQPGFRGQYKGPSEAFVTYYNISYFFIFSCLNWYLMWGYLIGFYQETRMQISHLTSNQQYLTPIFWARTVSFQESITFGTPTFHNNAETISVILIITFSTHSNYLCNISNYIFSSRQQSL